MSAVRPFEREDLEAVASLYERVVRGGDEPSERLLKALESATLTHPWADPELPSLVYVTRSGQIAGFQASYARRLVLDDRPLRLVSCGQLVADPEAEGVGIGGQLMRRMLSGPQDLTLTDGASGEVRDMWARLGGATSAVTSIGWTHWLHPARLALRTAAMRAGRGRTPTGSGYVPPPSEAEELTPERLVEQIGRSRARLRCDYDVDYLTWLFAEMEAVEGRGPLARRLVLDEAGTPAGWYVAYMPRGATAQAIGLASARPDPGLVIDRLLADARAAGCHAVKGRVEPALLRALTKRRCLFSPTEWALADYTDDDVAAAVAREQALITRLDGEWWMGYHLEPGSLRPAAFAATVPRRDGDAQVAGRRSRKPAP